MGHHMATAGRTELSPRERQLLKLAASGLTDTAISVRLGISETTVKTYWRRIREKLGRNSRTELVAMVLRSEIEKTLSVAREARAGVDVTNPNDARFYRLLLDNAPDAILIVVSDGTISMVNESAAELFGWSIEELQGQHITDLLPERFWLTHEQHLKDYFTSPSKRSMGDHISTSAVHKSGAEIKIAANLSAIGSADNMAVICIIRSRQGQK
jgi:PAS domain S-box-containing protein